MFRQTNTTGRALRRGLGLIAIFATLSLSLSANGVLAARGGKTPSGTPAKLTFDDSVGDTIRSDGLGSYAATIENQILTVSTGKKRSLFFEFSNCLPGACESPFGSETSGTVANTTMKVWLQDTPEDGSATAVFEFKGVGGNYQLSLDGLIGQFDDDQDGIIDRYVIEGSSGCVFRRISTGPSVPRGTPPKFEFVGCFSMPFGATVIVE
ncbi:MAG: hypothetical protein ACYTGZ_13230 [Planctomycetota bacterium]|jgi:hypothetical protein